ncbi:hypothetical protein H6F51_21575 [Cyanobacteria bacterium FACHB-DQ100]|nr:hypothetical protein [Cyanobacteria bacterium FACHB-DQ100]
MPNRAAKLCQKPGHDRGLATTCNLIVIKSLFLSTIDQSPPAQTAMEETIDFVLNSEPAIAPMTIEAWLILAFMLTLVAWGLMGERRDS